MSEIIESVRLIQVDHNSNHNKHWSGTLYDDGSYYAEWGRVGSTGQSGTFQGEAKFRKKIREKEKKGYVEQQTIRENISTKVDHSGDIHEIAKAQIKTDSPELEKLIERLINSNIHQITSHSQITYNSSNGLFQTPLGIVTLDGIHQADRILDKIFNMSRKEGSEFYNLAGKYLSIVPQQVGKRVKDFIDQTFTDDEEIRKQKDLLDSLTVSFKAINQPNIDDLQNGYVTEKIFDLTLSVLTDSKEYSRLEKQFYSSKKSMHNYDNIKIKNIYSVNIANMSSFFDNKPWGNIREYYHGTSVANCLSILKSGLKVSPPSTAAIAGKMFGNGVYGADSSSKSLGYSLGRWGQGRSNDGAWLFVCDFAMGKSYEPTHTMSSPPSGYDSISALKHKTSLYNDEFIVYNNNQVNIKYLIECET